MATLKKKLASAVALKFRLVKVATRSETDTFKARTDLQNLRARVVKVELEAMLAREDLDKVREPSAEAAKAAEKALRQLTEISH